VDLSSNQIIAMVVGASFAAGLNVYATVATLGLLGQMELLKLPPALDPLTSWYVIGAAGALFVVEFFADKIPAFDLVWNALHTFVRVPIAALLAYGATTQLSPGQQLLSAVMASAIAFAAHSTKTAVRAAVTPSPEPVSNVALSLGEDVVAVGLTWFATAHPYIAATLVLIALVLSILLLRFIWRALKRSFQGARRQLGTAWRNASART
jgi:hypothetical protein